MNAPPLQLLDAPPAMDEVELARTAVITTSASLATDLAAVLDEAMLTAPLGPLPASAAALLANIAGRPEVVVLDGREDVTAALQLAAELDHAAPHIGVVMVTEHSDDPAMLRASARAGVRDLLHPEADHHTARTTLSHVGQVARQHAANAQAANPESRGRVITVTSSKGGAGKSTTATNLAVGLNRLAPGRTVIVDFDVQFGDVAAMLGVRYEHTLADAVSTSDTLVLKTQLATHPSGLGVLASPESLSDDVPYEAAGRLLDQLAAEFDYVVVDTAAGLSDLSITALDRSSDVVLVVPLAGPAVRGMERMLAAMDELGVDEQRRVLVINQANAGGGLKTSLVEQFLGQPADHSLPVSKAALAATNTGAPLLLEGPGKDPLGKALAGLVQRFAPPEPVKTSRWRGNGRHRK